MESLKNYCHYAAFGVYNRIINMGDSEEPIPKILRLRFRSDEAGKWGGIHFVVEFEGYIIDPTYTQYDETSLKTVWAPNEEYPLRLNRRPEDVTQSILRFFNGKNQNEPI